MITWQYEPELIWCSLCKLRGIDGVGTEDITDQSDYYFEICRDCLVVMGEVYMHKILPLEDK